METDGSPPLELGVTEEEAELRLDGFLRRRLPGVSRGSIHRLLERGLVLVDGQRRAKGERLRSGQQIVVAAAARSERPVPQPELDLAVLAVEPDLVVIDKPAGISCHPLLPGETDTVANALVARFPECASASPALREGGLVHRLDWSTSGLLLAARGPAAYGRLRGLFSSGQVEKRYLALVQGTVRRPGRIEAPLRTVPGEPARMEVAPPELQTLRGQAAETAFHPLEEREGRTLLCCTAHTGRRHQIRVHLAHLGHPLLGDVAYGGPELVGLEGAFLHAATLRLIPDGRTYRAPLPADRRRILARLGFATARDGFMPDDSC